MDSDAVLLVHETDTLPHYAFPVADVHVDGEPEPHAPGHVTVAWEAMEEWYEEDERVEVHRRDTYHRIDTFATSRVVRVSLAAIVLAESRRARAVFETWLQIRWYLPRDDVRFDLLEESATVTRRATGRRMPLARSLTTSPGATSTSDAKASPCSTWWRSTTSWSTSRSTASPRITRPRAGRADRYRRSEGSTRRIGRVLPGMQQQTDATRSGVAVTPDRLCDVRSLTEELAAPLSAEDQTVQSMPDVSPTKWHRGHTTWFFETFVLAPNQPDYQTYDPRFGYLFNSYYEAIGPRQPRPDRGLLSRPAAREIADYRRHVDSHLLRFLHGGIGHEVADLVELGLHHEQQHQELLLMDIKHVLSCNPLDPAYRDRIRRPSGRPAGAGWLTSEGGLVEIGHDQRGFAFDNELPRHTVHLRPYAIAAAPVTNADWLAFIEDGGYARPELWLSDGWTAINSLRSDAPLYWCEQDGGWSCFTLAGRLPLDPAEPVCHVSYYEADAFARWAGCRLPTEVEWEHALGFRVGTRPRFDLDDLHPRPVTSDHAGVGEVWEWTASAYLPYPGFRPAAGAIGEYNGKFMVGQHVLRGSSCVTPPGHARSTYRNFFPPSARWPFTGLRLAKDAD